MSSESKYIIRLMNENDCDQVLSLLNNSFFHDEPISKCLHATGTLHFCQSTLNSCLKDQCSYIACDKETNKIVAICLNEITYRNSNDEIDEPDEKMNYILHLLAQVHKKIDLFQELDADTLLHVFIISVDKAARGHRLATELISKSIDKAKSLNIKGVYAEATNVYSLNCFKREQFDVFYELIYRNYDGERLAELDDPSIDRCYLVGRKI